MIKLTNLILTLDLETEVHIYDTTDEHKPQLMYSGKLKDLNIEHFIWQSAHVRKYLQHNDHVTIGVY